MRMADVYKKMSEFLTLMGCHAALFWREARSRIRNQAQQLTREYTPQCLYLYYPVLKQHIQDQPISDSFYDSDDSESEGKGTSSSAVVSVASHQRTTSSSQQEDEHDEDVYALLEEESVSFEKVIVGKAEPTQVNSDEPEQSTADVVEPPAAPLYKCTALCTYVAQNSGELSIIKSEELELVGEEDGEGWVCVRNYRGVQGMVPHNYLDVNLEQFFYPLCPSTGDLGLDSHISFSSVDYTVEEEVADVEQPSDQISEISAPLAKPKKPKVEEPPEMEPVVAKTSQASVPTPKAELPTLGYCFAYCDYNADGFDQLSFKERQIIRIVSRQENGWWRGEANGVVGNFPSLLVEECDEIGERLLEDWSAFKDAVAISPEEETTI